MRNEIGQHVMQSKTVGTRSLGGRSVGGKSLGRSHRIYGYPKPPAEKTVRVDKRPKVFVKAGGLSVGELVQVNKMDYRVAWVAQTVQLLPAHGGPGALIVGLGRKVRRRI